MKANWIEFIIGMKSDNFAFKGVSSPFQKMPDSIVKKEGKHLNTLRADLLNIENDAKDTQSGFLIAPGTLVVTL